MKSSRQIVNINKNQKLQATVCDVVEDIKTQSNETFVKACGDSRGKVSNIARNKNDLDKALFLANERKLLRDKYTIRSKCNNSNALVNQNTDGSRKISEEHRSQKVEISKVDGSGVEKKTVTYRKPVITTITERNDSSKVYKTVTFTDKRESTPILINIPTQTIKTKEKPAIKPLSVKPQIEPNVKEKIKNRTKFKRERTASPHLKKPACPPTEVAKWAPQSITTHTKPYYEAWVDTTLTAITKTSENDLLYIEKKKLLDTFERMLERPRTPELVYNNMDERYTGKIKVRTKINKK